MSRNCTYVSNMIILELCYLFCSFSAACADICYNKSMTSYGKIGQELTLLDIDAEEISRLQGPCYMEVKIKGAEELEIRVVNAKFGGNHGTKYVGLRGMKQEYIEDKMSIKFNSCSSNSSGTLTTFVYTGLNITFKSDVVCFLFEPETQYKGQGGHTRGGRILILVTVREALCKQFSGTEEMQCEPRCNASEELHNCETDICYNKSMTSYGKIGQELTLLDIDAEDISMLQGPCYMEVKINGAKTSEIRVLDAKFGGNHGTKYVGHLGMKQEYNQDKISMKVNSCSSNSSRTMTTLVSTGLNMTFKSDVVCLIFEPETYYKGLGGHTRGGRIIILVTVKEALCKPFSDTKDTECQPRCNAAGELHNCDSDICYNKSMTSYGKIGQELTLLDIDAEDISRLQGPCYMEVKINGAKTSEIRVLDAKFGGNHGTKYVGLMGMKQEYIEDKMSIKFNTCSSNSSETLTMLVYIGLNITFKSDVVCFLFEPEAQYKGIGSHTRGGRILILVTVREAPCNPFNGTKDPERHPRCNAAGELHNCDSGTGSVSVVVYRFLLMCWFVQLDFGALWFDFRL